jgi:VCBS repeat-containing protein
MAAGTEFQVPVTNAGESQFFEGASALLPGGNVAVAWSNDGGSGTDEAIGVRVIRPDGSAITAELVDAGTAGIDRFPAVVAIDETHFAVIYCNFSPDYVHIEVVGRVYTIVGNTLVAGPVKPISDPVSPDDNGNGLSAVRLDDGTIAVAWGQYPPGSYSTATVMARTFTSNLDPLSPETQVSATNISSPNNFQISAKGEQVAISWTQNQADTKVHALGASLTVNPDGSIAPRTLLDRDISVNGNVRAMTTLANGDILVVYVGGPSVGTQLDDYDKLFGKIYGSGFTGNPVAFQINETVVDTGTGLADVVAFENGGFAVYWSQIPGGGKSELYTRTYDKNYQAATHQTQVNAPNGVNDSAPSAVVDDKGNVTLIWEQGTGATPSRVIIATALAEQDPDAQGPKLEGDNAVTVSEGLTVVLTTADITVTNPGKSPELMVYTVSGLSHGTVLVDGVPSNTFTQAQLEAGKVSFLHDGSETTTGSFTVTADFSGDPAETTATINVSVTPVNDRPAITFAQDLTASEDVSYALTGITVGDPDAVNLTVTLRVDAGTLSALSGAGVTVSQFVPGELQLFGSVSSVQQFLNGGSVKFLTAPNSNASTVLTVTATDGGDLSDVQTKTITITPINDQPTITHAGPSTKAEDMTRFFTDITIADPDGTNGPVTVTISVDKGTLFFPTNPDGVTISGTQTMQTLVGTIDKINEFLHSTRAAYMSPQDMNGTVNVIVTADDGMGGTSSTISYQITVTPVNDDPVIGGDKTVTVSEGTSYVLTLDDISASDVDDDAVSYTVSTLPSDVKVMIGAQEVSTFSHVDVVSGVVRIVHGPDADAGGTISLTASDGKGSTVPVEISIDVSPVNDAPQAFGGTVSVAEDGSRAFLVSDFVFSDALDVPADSLDAVLITTLPSLGRLTFDERTVSVGQAIPITEIGKLVYEPAANGNGASYTEIGFRLRDDGGTANGGYDTSAEAFIRIDVALVNDAAVIGGTMNGSVTEDGTLVAFGALTVSDIDDRGEAGFQAQADVKGSYGTFSFDHATGDWTYVLDNDAAAVQNLHHGEFRQETFTVKSLDGTAGIVTVTVTGTKDADVIDGVQVDRTETVNTDGSVSQVVTIPVVTSGRSETDGTAGYADIPLVSAGGRPVLLAQVPVGYGLQVTGPSAPQPAGSSLTDLIRAIKAHTLTGSADQNQLTGGGSGFLQGLSGDTPLVMQTIMPMVAPSSTTVPGQPLVISGLPAAVGMPQTALVIDTRGLPSSSQIELQNVNFAVVIGAVTVTGGAGSQVVYGDGANQSIVLGADDDELHGGAGDDYVGSHGGNDWLYGDDGNDTVSGGEGNDWLYGGAGNDRLLGGSGKDRLDGGAGNDALKGEAGNDWITGGLGRDKLWGGAGRDVFDFNSVQESKVGSQRDIIQDFRSGQDRVDLRGIDANELRKGNQKFSWTGSDGPFLHPKENDAFLKAGFTGKAGELRYAGGILMGDTDGDRRADFQIKIFGKFVYSDVIL